MKLCRFAAISCIMFLTLLRVSASMPEDYAALKRKASTMSATAILKEGERLASEGEPDQGIALLSVAADRFDRRMSEEDKRVCVDICLRMGKIHYSQSNYSEALRQFLRALDISEECADKPSVMEIYNCIGLAYCGFEDYETGLHFMRTGYSLRGKFPDRVSESNLLLNLAGYSCQTDDVSEARGYLEKAKELVAPGDSMREYMVIYNEGYIKAKERRYGEACDLLHKAAGYLRSPERRCYAYDRLYLTYRDWGKTDSMFRYLKETHELARECGLRDLQIQTLRDLSDYYRDREPQRSMEYCKEYLALSDSVFNKRDFYALRNLQYTRETERRNREMAELEMKRAMDQERIRIQRVIIICVAVLLLSAAMFLTILIRQKRALSASYADLFRQSKNLLRQDEERRRDTRYYEEQLHALKVRETGQGSESPETAEAPSKYSHSTLNDTTKHKIKCAISHIANDTEEIYAPDFSLNKLSQLVGSNNQYVSQIINEAYSKNFNDFINEIRVRRACACLLDTERYGNLSVQGIAEMVGYRSQSTFFRAFKKFVGFSPVVYQKMALKKDGSAADL